MKSQDERLNSEQASNFRSQGVWVPLILGCLGIFIILTGQGFTFTTPTLERPSELGLPFVIHEFHGTKARILGVLILGIAAGAHLQLYWRNHRASGKWITVAQTVLAIAILLGALLLFL